jgi:transcriptional regulator with XRE-family HTH domain
VTRREPPVPLPALPSPARRRKLRLAVGLTIIQAAAEMGVDRNTFSRWERGLVTIRPEDHHKYAAQLAGWQHAVDAVE